MSSIELLVNALNDTPDSEIIIRSQELSYLSVLINLKRVDGKTVPYQLEIHAVKNNKVVVSELTQLLPKCCPERHINSDGTFCLSWQDDIDLSIIDIEKAAFGGKHLLASYLNKNEFIKRQWPDQNAWAHGSAAKFQRDALSALDQVGANFKTLVFQTLYKSLIIKLIRATVVIIKYLEMVYYGM